MSRFEKVTIEAQASLNLRELADQIAYSDAEGEHVAAFVERIFEMWDADAPEIKRLYKFFKNIKKEANT